MAFKIRNKYLARCKTCGKQVKVGSGWSTKNNGGRWFSVCDDLRCASLQGVEGVGAPEKRELLTQGDRLAIQMPYDKSALPLLRSLPGARWDSQAKVWTCSVSAPDRSRVLEIADRLKLDVPDELRVVEDSRRTDALKRVDGTPLFPFQVDGVEFLALKTRALLADDMGLGKTVQVLMALENDSRTLVVCPNSVRYVWRDELLRWRPDLQPVVVASGRATVPSPGEVVIVNFEKAPLVKDAAQFNGVRLVVDEAHFCKNFRSLRTKKITAVAKVAVSTWLLTGTPLANRPLDLWGTLNAGGMAFEVFGTFQRFVTLFGGHKNRWGGWEFAPKPIPEAAERLRRVMLRRHKDDVLQDLPSKRYQTIVVNGLDKKLMKKLDELASLADVFIDAGELPPFEKFSAIRAELATFKISAAEDLIASYEEAGEPVVVFSAHRAPVETLGAREGWGMIAGGMSAEDRAATVKAFQTGELKGIALTIGAGAEGLTLTKASRMLFVDLDWVPGRNLQAEDRIRRIGQTAQSLEYIRLVVDHAMDRRVLELLDSKARLIEGAVEATVDYTAPEPVRTERESDNDWSARVAEHKAKLAKAETTRQQKLEQAERDAHLNAVQRILGQERQRANGEAEVPESIQDPAYRRQLIEAHTDMLTHCDGARTLDGVGFNKPDAARAVSLTAFDLDTTEAASALWLLLRRYRRQLSERGHRLF
jgi:SWI/SNF-related matrix-associated actin-dependent regulator 1 of chromatin subfamily A